VSERWLLPPLWFDLCWEIGRFDEYPFPLAVRSHGETLEERAVLKQRALPEMQSAGLIAGEGLAPNFAKVLAQIAKPGLWIEGLWMPDDTNPSPVRLLSIVFEQFSILLIQAPGESESHGGDLHISVHRDSIAAAVVQGMPPAPPGKRPRLAVPQSALKPDDRAGDEDFGNVSMMDGGRSRGQDPAKALRELVDSPHFRDGQFTVNLRDRTGRTRRSSVFKWFDAFEPDGRYGLTQQHRSGVGPELVVAPIGPTEIRGALDNRVNEIRS
jgi:hypothetical protein